MGDDAVVKRARSGSTDEPNDQSKKAKVDEACGLRTVDAFLPVGGKSNQYYCNLCSKDITGATNGNAVLPASSQLSCLFAYLCRNGEDQVRGVHRLRHLRGMFCGWH